MLFFDFHTFPLWLNLAVFVFAAVGTWLVGSRLTAYADAIADRTGIGQAFVGLVLLAGATSLPEMSTTVTASAIGNAPLAVNNLLGGAALQITILAVADLMVRRGALTFFIPKPVLMLNGSLLITLLTLPLMMMLSGLSLSVFGVGLGSVVLFATYALYVLILKGYEGKGRWRPIDLPDEVSVGVVQGLPERPARGETTRRLVYLTAAVSIAILALGATLGQVADALAVQTGLGSSFVGATLLAGSTSLPELSTTVSAVRLGAFSMAVSNMFGSNALRVALVFLADLFYRDGPVLSVVGGSSSFAVALAILLTSIYLVGMIERRNLTVLRMGLDSVAVLFLYGVGLIVLYLLR